MKENLLRKDGVGIVDTSIMELVAIPQGDKVFIGKEINKVLVDLPRGTKVIAHKEVKEYW